MSPPTVTTKFSLSEEKSKQIAEIRKKEKELIKSKEDLENSNKINVIIFDMFEIKIN